MFSTIYSIKGDKGCYEGGGLIMMNEVCRLTFLVDNYKHISILKSVSVQLGSVPKMNKPLIWRSVNGCLNLQVNMKHKLYVHINFRPCLRNMHVLKFEVRAICCTINPVGTKQDVARWAYYLITFMFIV